MTALARREGHRKATITGANVYAAALFPSAEVYVKRVSVDEYDFYHRVGLGRWLRYALKAVAGAPGAYTPIPHHLRAFEILFLTLAVNETDPSLVYTGTWSGTPKFSETTNDYVVYTAPLGTTQIGVDREMATNRGYAKVEIDGDATRANLCYTAQQEVDAGRLASTALVSGGGTLNPTDRVLEFHSSATPPTDWMIVDGLAPGEVHTAKFTVTGYKRAASTGTRVCIDTMWYSTDAITPATASVYIVTDKRLMETLDSTWEYAYRMRSGGVDEWAGQTHGYEKEITFALVLDGVATTMTDGQILSATSITVNKTAELYHPNVGAGATVTCNVTTIYTLNQDGIRSQHTDVWAQTLTPVTCYPAMMSLHELESNRLYETWLRGSGSAISVDWVLDLENDVYRSIGQSEYAWLWSPADTVYLVGQMFAVARLTNHTTALQSYTYAGTDKSFIQDRIGGVNARINKVYFTLMSDSLAVGTMPNVVNGTTWTSDCTYRFGRVADAVAICSRGL